MTLVTQGVLGRRVLTPGRRQEEVRGCALYLDGVRPGWEHQVDALCLNFASATMCVVGQIWGSIYDSPEWGVIASTFPGAVTGGMEFWQHEIASRRAKRSTFPVEWTKQKPLVVV